MGRTTEIAWTDATFNPWWGCAKVSEGCKNCYAEQFAKRVGQKVWGEGGERRIFGEKHWREPLKWNAEAQRSGVRRRVFCASMADVFEDHAVAAQERPRLWKLIAETPWLDWLLLTKRPENIKNTAPKWGDAWPNIWLGVTAENQQMANKRIPLLLAVPAVVRFVSAEPLLGPITFPRGVLGARGGLAETFGNPLIHWVIVGGESGHKARRFEADWSRSLVEQCHEAGAACFVKQMGANVRDRNDVGFHGGMGDEFENEWPDHLAMEDRIEDNPNGFREEYQGAPVRIRLRSTKGGDMAEWPADLRVRQFPGEAR